MIFTARYADGWNGTVVNPMTRSEAARRHDESRPYAVLLVAEGRVHTVVHTAGGYYGVDGIRKLELRRTPEGDLFLRSSRSGDTTTTWTLAGRREDLVESPGASSRDFRDEAAPRIPEPLFGDWAGLLKLAGISDAEVAGGDGPELPSSVAAEPPWQLPQPAGPRDFTTLFTGGAEVTVAGHEAVVAVLPPVSLTLTSGRLVAADPEVLYGGPQLPFTVTVPPGTYPVTVATVRFRDRPRSRVSAARLEITDHPVARWEPALQPGQSALDLGNGEYYGFGVDTGQASFADADVWNRLSTAGYDARDDWEQRWIDLGDRVREHLVAEVEPGMVAWPSGWGDGSYPTWIGYDTAGEVVCFVADMRL